MISIGLGFVLGLLLGLVTGLTPGLHVNVVAALVAAGSAGMISAGVPALALGVFVVAVAVAHSCCEIIPALFLGVPDDAYALLPGHQMVRHGRGLEAVHLSLYGCRQGLHLSLGLVALLLLLAWFDLNLLQWVDRGLRSIMAYLLLAISAALVLRDKRPGWALLVMGLSGLFGLLTFNSGLIPGTSESAFGAIFPALTGIFAVSGLLLVLRTRGEPLPPQLETAPEVRAPGAAALGACGGVAVGLLPGLGAGNAAACFSLRSGSRSGEDYLVITGAINIADALFGILALFLIDRSRSGASVALAAFLPVLSKTQFVGLCIAMLLAANLVIFGVRAWAPHLMTWINRLDGRALNLATLAFLTLLVVLTTGFWGLLFLATGTALGLIAPASGVRRAQAMGFFLVPTILFYSGWMEPTVTWLGLEAFRLPGPQIELGSLVLKLAISLGLGLIVYRSWTGERPGRAHSVHHSCEGESGQC